MVTIGMVVSVTSTQAASFPINLHCNPFSVAYLNFLHLIYSLWSMSGASRVMCVAIGT